MFGLPLAVFATLVTPLLAGCDGPQARTSPADHEHWIVVDKSGAYPGSYKTVEEGIAQLNEKKSNLFIFPGAYCEQVVIPKDLDRVSVQGYTCDTTKYRENTVTITQAKAQRDLSKDEKNQNFQTSTIGIKANQVKLYNINVANTAGRIPVNGQGVAVFAGGNDHGFYGCSFTGYQNTLAANNGRILIAGSHISGAVDFIFGQYGMLWSEKCNIEVVGDGWITANGNKDDDVESEFVFNRADVNGKGHAFLGRPWQKYSRCVWQNSYLDDIVDPEGWSEWNGGPTDNVYFKEFKNKGPGANTDKRVPFSGQLDKAVKVEDILGDVEGDFFYDSSFM
ncbi:pectin methylesterase [Plasmopara halstedii]|uniref:Pectinesterase n=1 Tax=Plasmopara halstedii TaxID=4781 RepID=A0A0P1APU7_PLAHL|nr:pectin methylesterase [Plasmopara halstedii]CEG43070.1 pectin methylesterase [Plasmopara halstedii]|eukprot:XP_024579439.1 pectin methylesterase [Plasmopara halstedii]